MLTAISRLKAYKEMSGEEKGDLLDTLCALEGSGGGFYADLKFTVPLTTSQIANLLGWKEYYWEYIKNTFVDGKILKEHNGSVYCPYMTQVSADSINDEAREIALEILAHWNSKKIIVHNETPALLKSITKYVRKHDYTLDQVRDAIDNYAIVLMGSEYYWTKKWCLNDFLSRGVARFHSDQKPLDVFRSEDGSRKKKAGRSIYSHREVSPLPTEDEL
jgi:hypothetical protein